MKRIMPLTSPDAFRFNKVDSDFWVGNVQPGIMRHSAEIIDVNSVVRRHLGIW